MLTFKPSIQTGEPGRHLSLRPAWSIQQVQGQPTLDNEGKKTDEDVIDEDVITSPSKQQKLAAVATWFWS